MSKKLRLVLTRKCDRACEGCCNKQIDFSKVPICTDFSGYDLIMITGGEPMIEPLLLFDTIMKIKQQTNAPIVIYTANVSNVAMIETLLNIVDGITITLHEQEDLLPFLLLDANIPFNHPRLSLRVNVFKEVSIGKKIINRVKWIVKDNIEWVNNCPLPEGEVLMQL